MQQMWMGSERIARLGRLVHGITGVHDPRHAKVRCVAVATNADNTVGTMGTGLSDIVQPWIQRRIEILAVGDFEDGGFVGDDDRGRIDWPVGKRCGWVGLVSVPFIHVGWWGEKGGGAPKAVGEIDAEGRLGCLG